MLSIASSIWSGFTAGESAARYANNRDYGQVDYGLLDGIQKRFFLPAQKECAVNPDSVVYQLQKILFPVDVLIMMKEETLARALAKVISLKEDFAGKLQAEDVRGLMKVRETETMLLAAEMTLKAALMRTETRPNIFYREDYPETDNTCWLKWITVMKGSGESMEFSFEDISFERYKFKPGCSL